ncbi:DUF4442 domain-containing protein [Fibrella sp. HMF5335]|uniref:DUF4442 domain-containing protein n=1 Tax=Fibrella rubiginis TaxID=2817060 RepID=A0A939GE16_9BACT|nr:DUF4442 domain-containing protein [Fibrella rubiginis]MBO0935780.1 DUF4442 domain-containing protein [Fibrella rubiginis]
MTNRFDQLRQHLATLPVEARTPALTTTMQRIIPMLGTLGVVFEVYEAHHCQLYLPNVAAVQNGWGGIQAGGIYTTAESAMALVIGANLADNQVVVAKTVTIDYRRRAQGGIRATATLTSEGATHIGQTERGELTLTSPITDETGTEVAHCQAVWVWMPVR